MNSIPTFEEFLNESFRPIYVIAGEIQKDWRPIDYSAKPYLDAMFQLETIKDKYYMDDATSIISYFLANASKWKGEKAKMIKAELKHMIK